MSTWIPIPVFKTDSDGGGGGGDGRRDIEIPIEFVFYAIIAIFLMIVVLMIKLLCDNEGGRRGEGGRAGERSRLLSSKEVDLFIDYGTSIDDQQDIEAGNGNGSCSSSSDDLYDAKICVICYDDQRTCFFIPCGHCIACFTCAKRIISEENKSCPICRTSIDRVRVLHILQ